MLRLLGILIAAGVAILAIVLLAGVAIAVVRLVSALLLSVAAALAAGGIVWLLAELAGADDALALAAVAAVVALPVALWLRSRTADAPVRSSIPGPAAPPGQARAEPALPPEPANDHALTRAWDTLFEFLARDTDPLVVARSHCARLLRAADEDPMDAELLEGAVLVRRHVPELVQRTIELTADASPEERRDLERELRESVVAIGRRSEEVLAERRAQRRSALSVRHMHVRRPR